jgi:hypothetical protein
VGTRGLSGNAPQREYAERPGERPSGREHSYHIQVRVEENKHGRVSRDACKGAHGDMPLKGTKEKDSGRSGGANIAVNGTNNAVNGTNNAVNGTKIAVNGANIAVNGSTDKAVQPLRGLGSGHSASVPLHSSAN